MITTNIYKKLHLSLQIVLFPIFAPLFVLNIMIVCAFKTIAKIFKSIKQYFTLNKQNPFVIRAIESIGLLLALPVILPLLLLNGLIKGIFSTVKNLFQAGKYEKFCDDLLKTLKENVANTKSNPPVTKPIQCKDFANGYKEVLQHLAYALNNTLKSAADANITLATLRDKIDPKTIFTLKIINDADTRKNTHALYKNLKKFIKTADPKQMNDIIIKLQNINDDKDNQNNIADEIQKIIKPEPTTLNGSSTTTPGVALKLYGV